MSDMIISEAAANTALDTFQINKASLHSGDPGTNGANELSSQDYARQDFGFSAANGAQRQANTSAVFNVAVDDQVAWIAYWNDTVFTIARRVDPAIVYSQDGTLTLGDETVLEL